MRGKIAILTTLMLFAMPAVSAAETEIATGHIEAGGPHTELLSASAATGEEGIDAFFFDSTAVQGETITTDTTDNSDLGYDLDIYWYDAEGSYLSACATPDSDETCEVPSNAAEGEVAAWLGADLDVTVLHLEE